MIRYSRTSKGNKTLPVFFALQEIACKVKKRLREDAHCGMKLAKRVSRS